MAHGHEATLLLGEYLLPSPICTTPSQRAMALQVLIQCWSVIQSVHRKKFAIIEERAKLEQQDAIHFAQNVVDEESKDVEEENTSAM